MGSRARVCAAHGSGEEFGRSRITSDRCPVLAAACTLWFGPTYKPAIHTSLLRLPARPPRQNTVRGRSPIRTTWPRGRSNLEIREFYNKAPSHNTGHGTGAHENSTSNVKRSTEHRLWTCDVRPCCAVAAAPPRSPMPGSHRATRPQAAAAAERAAGESRSPPMATPLRRKQTRA